MFLTDINEFKNEKILGRLRDATLLFDELNEMTKVIKESSESITRNRLSFNTNYHKVNLLNEPSKELLQLQENRSCRTPPLLQSKLNLKEDESSGFELKPQPEQGSSGQPLQKNSGSPNPKSLRFNA